MLHLPSTAPVMDAVPCPAEEQITCGTEEVLDPEAAP
jgi:hypothetical protein